MKTHKSCKACGLKKSIDRFFHHPLMKDGLRNQCKDCNQQRKLDRQAAETPEETKRRKTRDKQSDKKRRDTTEYRAKHAADEKRKRYADIETFRASRRDHYARNLKSSRIILTPEQRQANQREAMKQHWANNRQQYRTRTLNYLARKKNAPGFHTANDIAFMLKHQRSRCFWCDDNINDQFHVDHLVPLSRGGSNGPDNLVAACDHCNRSKGAKPPHEFIAYRMSKKLNCNVIHGVPAIEPPVASKE